MKINLLGATILTTALSLAFYGEAAATPHGSHPASAEYHPAPNVYEVLSMSTMMTTQIQLTEVEAEVAATDAMNGLQQTDYQSQINQINQSISAKKQAESTEDLTARLTENLPIALGALMTVGSIAVYTTGVGAPVVISVDDSAMTKQINELNEMIYAPTAEIRREEPAPLK